MSRQNHIATLMLLATVTCPLARVTSAQTSDERAIRALIESHAVAWNQRDIKAASDVYSASATIITGAGQVYVGRAAVEQWHADALAGPNPSTHTHPSDTIRIVFVRPDVAVADVESHSPGPIGPDGQPGPVRKAPLFIVLLKTTDGWRIAAQRPTTLPVQ